MKAIEFLKQPSVILSKIKYLELELERYEVMMNSCKVAQYDIERVSQSPNRDSRNMRGLEKYYETEAKIKEAKKELNDAINKLNQTIEQVDNYELKLLLKYRYVDRITMEEIVDKFFVSYATIKRWHKEALKEIESIINKNEPL